MGITNIEEVTLSTTESNRRIIEDSGYCEIVRSLGWDREETNKKKARRKHLAFYSCLINEMANLLMGYPSYPGQVRRFYYYFLDRKSTKGWLRTSEQVMLALRKCYWLDKEEIEQDLWLAFTEDGSYPTYWIKRQTAFKKILKKLGNWHEDKGTFNRLRFELNSIDFYPELEENKTDFINQVDYRVFISSKLSLLQQYVLYMSNNLELSRDTVCANTQLAPRNFSRYIDHIIELAEVYYATSEDISHHGRLRESKDERGRSIAWGRGSRARRES